MEKIKLLDRIKYWIDKRMSKNTSGLVLMLGSVIIVFLLLVSFLIIALKINEDFLNVTWDLLSTTINAWMPEYDDNVVYMLIQAIMAIIGLLFTSFLIGVISNAIEDRLNSLRKGKTRIIENNHTIVVGFEEGSYELLNQLVIASGDKKRTIVVCDQMEKDEMEDSIHGNIDVPKNIDIICRNIDITNPSEFSVVVPEKARTVIINIMDDKKTVKATLAVLTYLRNFPDNQTKVVSSVSAGKYLLPTDSMKEKNCLMIKTNDFISKLIAHTIAEPGLSVAYKEFLGSDGNEMYFESVREAYDLNITELSSRINNAVVIGIKRRNRIILNPDRDSVIKKGDELILLENRQKSYTINPITLKDVDIREINQIKPASKGKLVIFGYNYKLNTLLRELPDNFEEIVLANSNEDISNHINEAIKKNVQKNINSVYGNLNDKEFLNELVRSANHIIIINNDDSDAEEDDVANVLLMLKLLELRKKNRYSYNMTIELQLESSRNLIVGHRHTDFIIAYNIISMLLVQYAEKPELHSVFDELLSDDGNEIYVKPVELFNLKQKEYSIRSLKQILLTYGYILLGYDNARDLKLNPNNDERIEIRNGFSLIVLGRK